MQLPSFKNTAAATPSTGSRIAPEGEHDFAIRSAVHESRNGLEIVEIEAQLDNGENAGARVTLSYMWGDDEAKAVETSGRLKLLAQNLRTDDGALDGRFDDNGKALVEPGFSWRDDLGSWKEFAAQFAQRIGGLPMRFRGRVYHAVDIKIGDVWAHRGKLLKEAEKIEQEATADGLAVSRFTKAKVGAKSIQLVKDPSVLFAPGAASPAAAASGDGASGPRLPTPTPASAAPPASAYAANQVDVDEDLPF